MKTCRKAYPFTRSKGAKPFCYALPVILLLLGISVSVWAQRNGMRVTSMKLLTSQVGWAADRDHLFWTTDAAAHWKEITPKPTGRDEVIECVFFLNTDDGWVLFSHGDSAAGEPQVELASTTDVGATWSLTLVTIPHLQPGSLDGNGQTTFVDPSHGWMNLGITSGSAFRPGKSLVTSDGGRTWSEMSQNPGEAGDITLVTPLEGWLAGGPADRELKVTRDGGRSWQQISLPAPKEVYPATEATYAAPIFEGQQRGFITVHYSGGGGVKSAAVLFSTKDGGQTWAPEKTLPNLAESSAGGLIVSTVIDSTWITAIKSDGRSLVFAGFGTDEGVTDSSPHPDLYRRGIHQLSFVNPALGWVLASGLFSTSDGGKSWVEITPPASTLRSHGYISNAILSAPSTTFPVPGTTRPNVQTNIWRCLCGQSAAVVDDSFTL